MMTKLTLEKLLFIESQCINPQDAVIIRLLIEGLEIHEIVYLRNNVIDISNRILTIELPHSSPRRVIISQSCADLIVAALNQNQYYLQNGTDFYKESMVYLRESGYIIRPTMRNYLANKCMIQEMDSIILRTIYMRLRDLAEIFSQPELAYLTTVKLDIKESVYA